MEKKEKLRIQNRQISRWEAENWNTKFKSSHQANKVAKREMNDADYLIYRGIRPSCRITVPLISYTQIREAAMTFRRLATGLEEIHSNTSISVESRVKLAQGECVMANQHLKNKARRDYELDPDGTFNNTR